MTRTPVPRYDGLIPASQHASNAARGSAAKRDTKPELRLREAFRREGLRGYRVDVAQLPGRPDVVFLSSRVAVFCDGDFWHGLDLDERVKKLNQGHNAPYWVKKISGNVARDRQHDDELTADGWRVVRYWESHVRSNAEGIAREVASIVNERAATRPRSRNISQGVARRPNGSRA